jgi:hypothetical protein
MGRQSYPQVNQGVLAASAAKSPAAWPSGDPGKAPGALTHFFSLDSRIRSGIFYWFVADIFCPVRRGGRGKCLSTFFKI